MAGMSPSRRRIGFLLARANTRLDKQTPRCRRDKKTARPGCVSISDPKRAGHARDIPGIQRPTWQKNQE
jgi:hypothetical protein